MAMSDDPFRAKQGKLNRDAGMATAAAAQGALFGETAYALLVALARRQEFVHIDDMLRNCALKPRHFNAWGHVWMRALKNGVIEHSGRTALCQEDPGKNAHRYPIYRSLIFGQSRFAARDKERAGTTSDGGGTALR